MKRGLSGRAVSLRLLEVLLAVGAKVAARQLAHRFGIFACGRAGGVPTDTAISPSVDSSSVPSTWLWLARICSISVEPERGRPTMKIGASDS